MIAASIAALRPLFKTLHIPGSKAQEGYTRSHELSFVSPNIITQINYARQPDEGNESREHILNEDGIQEGVNLEVRSLKFESA